MNPLCRHTLPFGDYTRKFSLPNIMMRSIWVNELFVPIYSTLPFSDYTRKSGNLLLGSIGERILCADTRCPDNGKFRLPSIWL